MNTTTLDQQSCTGNVNLSTNKLAELNRPANEPSEHNPKQMEGNKEQTEGKQQFRRKMLCSASTEAVKHLFIHLLKYTKLF